MARRPIAGAGGARQSRSREPRAVAAGRRGRPPRRGPGRGDRTTTRSARNTASGIEWVTSTIVVPVRCHRSSSSALNRSRVSASRALNGSSSRSAAGSSASARAIATRWRMPPRERGAAWHGRTRAGRRGQQLRRRAAWRSRGQPASSSGKRTFSSTRAPGSRRGSWNTRPTAGSGPATGRPSIATEPASGAMSPARTRSSVLLPQPLGPMSATTSRGATSSEMVLEGGRRARAAERERDVVDADAGAGAGRDGRGGSRRRRGRVEPRIGPGAAVMAPPSYVAHNGAGRRSGRRPRVRTRRRRCLLPSGLYRRLRSARLAPRLRICRVMDDVRGAARGLVPRRGTLPPVGNCTLPRRLCPEMYHRPRRNSTAPPYVAGRRLPQRVHRRRERRVERPVDRERGRRTRRAHRGVRLDPPVDGGHRRHAASRSG